MNFKYIKFTVFVLVASLVFISCKTKKLTLADPQWDIESAIIDCISLLENKNYEALILKYVYPDDLENLLNNKTKDELIKNFAGKKATRLLKALKIAQNKEIEYKENKTVGVVHLGDDFEGPDEITFKKKDKLWYISD